MGKISTYTTTNDALTDFILGDTATPSTVKFLKDQMLAFLEPAINGGRLTLQTNVPVPIQDQAAQSTIYWTPYTMNRLALYDGTRWRLLFPGQISLAISGQTAGVMKDSFIDYNAGTPILTWGPAWTGNGQAITGATNATPIVISATAHGLSNGDQVYIGGVGGNTAANGTWIVAGSAANTFNLTGSVGNGTYTANTGFFSARAASGLLTTQDGVTVLTGTLTSRYMGTVRFTAATTTEDTLIQRYVWNAWNQVPRALFKKDATGHTYATATVRQWNATAADKVEFVLGLAGQAITSSVIADTTPSSSNGFPQVGLGLDSITVMGTAQVFISNNNAGPVYRLTAGASQADTPVAGYHYIALLETAIASGTDTFNIATAQSSILG